MDTRVLKYFLEVARQGNITKAAENLHISQPTLSRQIMDLEKSLGMTLLVREKKQISLTPGGLLFQQRAMEIVSLMEKTWRDLAMENDMVGGVIAVGCVETKAALFLQRILMDFKERHPGIRYELYSAGDSDIREKLDRGDLDMGILLEPVEAAKYDTIPLPWRERWGIVMRRDDPLAERDSVEIRQISETPLIIPGSSIDAEKISGWLGLPEEKLNIAASHNLLTNVLWLAENRFGRVVCVEGAYEARPVEKLCFRPFSPERTSGHMLAWKKNRVFTNAASLFQQYLQQKI